MVTYSDKVKERLAAILLTLLDLLTSKKFLVAMGTAIGTYQATGDPWVFLWAGLTFVGAQAAADWGKEKAKIDAATVSNLKQIAGQ